MMKRILKQAGLGALVLALAAVGVYLGMTFREMRAAQDRDFLYSQGPSSKLLVGSIFPNLELVSTAPGAIPTSRLYSGNGSIFMFLEPGCPPCESMTKKWQGLIDEGKFPRERVVGISFGEPENLEAYAKHNGLTFPIYSDTAAVFMRDFGVADFPLLVVVGKSGTIRMFTYDHRVNFDAAAIQEQLSN